LPLPGAISKICGDFELPLGREHFFARRAVHKAIFDLL